MTKPANKMSGLLDEDEQDQISNQAPLPPEEEPTIPDAPIATTTSTVRIPDGRGKRISQQNKLYSSIGISRKFLPRLTRKRSAIYQLVNWNGKRDRRYEGIDQIPDPPPYQLVPNYTFVDTEEPDLTNREKTLTFLDGGNEIVYTTDPVTKKSIPNSIPKVGAPEFIHGQKVINIFNNYSQYVWFELHPRNASNKYRNKGVEPIFERVDTKFQSPHVQNIMEDLRLEAGNYIHKLKTDELIKLASAMTNPTINTNVDPQEIRLTLRRRAWDNPKEVLFTTPNSHGFNKIAVINAMDFGVITFVPENEAFYYSDEDQPCFRVPTGNDPVNALIEYLSSNEGSTLLDMIKDDLSFWF